MSNGLPLYLRRAFVDGQGPHLLLKALNAVALLQTGAAYERELGEQYILEPVKTG